MYSVVMQAPQLIARLFRVPGGQRSALRIIWWWELRRIPYNLIMAVVGMASMFCIVGIDALPPRLPEEQLMWSPGFSAMGFGILANIAYTAGWIVELILRPALPNDAFKFGLGFSIVMAIVPPVVDFGAWLLRAVHR